MKLPWDRDDKAGRRNGPPGAADLRSPDPHDLGSLEPGDAVTFWGDGNKIVRTVIDCAEGIGARRYTWRWYFLDDGSLVEHSADGQWRYTEHEIVPQGSALFSEFVGTGGFLEQFEARVRSDTVGDNPVVVELRGRNYRITSTGIADINRRGDPPRLSPWAHLVQNPEENIYFSLVAIDDETQGVLGLWTSHVCLSFGSPISETDIDGIYRRNA
ncbi:MAG TPA: hypothetical protein VGW38_02665 [Chloroflexota bacterium]|nr:hypothetical protein [Chloroflexota bacterium]